MSEREGNGALCFWLGFFLSLFGLLIATIIGKRKGVVRAFQGMLLNAVIVFTFIFLFAFREHLFFGFIENRTHEYLRRCDNSVEIVREATNLVSPVITTWRKGTLTKSDKKIIMRVWIDLKNNLPKAIGGKPLTDDDLRTRIQQVENIINKSGSQSN